MENIAFAGQVASNHRTPGGHGGHRGHGRHSARRRQETLSSTAYWRNFQLYFQMIKN